MTADAPGRITVITVVRNSAARLRETIASVESAGISHPDLVIVDGGSTDGTVEVIRSHADRLHWWVSEPDHGIYDAMNKGWRAARNDSRILFLGAGDRIISLPAPGDLPADVVIYGDVWIGDRLFRGREGIPLRYGNRLHHQALLVPKSLHPSPPFDTRFRLYADFDFNQRLLKMGARFVKSPELSGYALPGGVSSRKDYRELAAVITKNFGAPWVAVALLSMILKRLSLPFTRNAAGGRP